MEGSSLETQKYKVNISQKIRWKYLIIKNWGLYTGAFVCFDSLHLSQQFLSHKETAHSRFNQY